MRGSDPFDSAATEAEVSPIGDAEAVLSSELLFAALRHGSEGELERLLPRLRVRLRRLAKQRLRDDACVEDVVQETLVTLWEKRSTLASAEQLLPFVFQVLRHKIGNQYSRQRQAQARDGSGAFPLDLLSSPQAASTHPETAARHAELEDLIERAIDRCGQEHEAWAPILRLLRAGRSPAEVRDELGLDALEPNALHARLSRARRRLKELLRAEFGIET